MQQQHYSEYHPPVRPRYHHRSLWDRTWKDHTGRVVLWQTPNVWLLVWAGFTTVSLFFTAHTADVLSWIASVALIVWSLFEVFRGVNYFRRLLGLTVLVFAVASLIKAL